MTTVYFAGPLFTQAEWVWNATVVEKLRQDGFDVTLPQERSIPMINGAEPFNAQVLFDANVAAIERCDAMIAILDQTDPDSGTAWECGYAYKSGRPVLGVRTDIRQAGDDGDLPVNLMIARSCSDFLTIPLDKRTDVEWVVKEIARKLQTITGDQISGEAPSR